MGLAQHNNELVCLKGNSYCFFILDNSRASKYSPLIHFGEITALMQHKYLHRAMWHNLAKQICKCNINWILLVFHQVEGSSNFPQLWNVPLLRKAETEKQGGSKVRGWNELYNNSPEADSQCLSLTLFLFLTLNRFHFVQNTLTVRQMFMC